MARHVQFLQKWFGRVIFMDWESVFFDFDGVILDSVDVKTKAFAEMFRSYGPSIEKSVVKYHLNNGGVSRFEKFRYYYEVLLKKQITEEIIKDLSMQFSDLVLAGVMASPFIPGAKESLVLLKQKGIPSYIVSATPEEEINLIVEKKGLKEYFEEIHGSPQKKDEICREIINRKRYNSHNCLFIGDAISDYDAAFKNGIRFIGIVGKCKRSPFLYGTPISSVVHLRL